MPVVEITNVRIANIAIAELGGKRLTTLTDASKEAALVDTYFQLARAYVMVIHPWNFALRRQTNLAKRGVAPEWGFDNAYTIPPEALRIIEVASNEVPVESDWKAETASTGELILVTNDDPVDILYIRDVVEPGRFSVHFTWALAKYLKALLAKPLTGKVKLQQEALKEFRAWIAEARSIDGQEGFPDDYTPTDLEDVR